MLDLGAGDHAQMDFSGLGYAIPRVVHAADARPVPSPGVSVDQLAFAFDAAPVQLSMRDWHSARDKNIALLADHLPKRAKTRKQLRAVAKRGATCGTITRTRVCAQGHEDARSKEVCLACDTRTCPHSARAHALDLRRRLLLATERWRPTSKGPTWWLHTITVRRPWWTSIERLRADVKRAWRAWHAAWAVLRALAGASRAFAHVEVAPGGMVHIHILAFHRWMSQTSFSTLRSSVVDTIGGGTRQYHVVRCGTGSALKGAVAEVAKYVTKGVAMTRAAEQTHPMLAALVEVAFRGRQLQRWYGDWDGLDGEDAPPEPPWSCPCCGSLVFRWRMTDWTTGEIRDGDALPDQRPPPRPPPTTLPWPPPPGRPT